MRFTLQDVAAATGGTLHGDGAIEIDGAAIDSRSLHPGQLFVAVVADRDGHDFLHGAFAAGAAAALVDRRGDHEPVVVVDDTISALQELARSRASGSDRTTIGITGSVGKTSTKDLLVSACRTRWRTHGSAGSFNNEMGVPLTVLEAPDDTEVLIVEMGARGEGHIADLCRIAQPSVGIVTAVGAAHTELFGTLADVARAKGELIEALPDRGTAVLNADDPRVAAMASLTSASVLTFGLEGGEIRATDIVVGDDLCPSFRLHTPWGEAPVELTVAGRHMVLNALAAAGGALAVHTPLTDVVEGLRTASVSRWRMDVQVTRSGAVVINDAYNANPMSMEAAFAALEATEATRKIAVLGVMAELGAEVHEAHIALGHAARDAGFAVIAVGVPEYGGTQVADAGEAITVLEAMGPFGPDDAVLVKGSRVASLERVAAALLSTA